MVHLERSPISETLGIRKKTKKLKLCRWLYDVASLNGKLMTQCNVFPSCRCFVHTDLDTEETTPRLQIGTFEMVS